MAQPAGFMAEENQTDMGIPVFWTSASTDPPWNFKVWLDQFKLAVTVKDSVNPDKLLEDPKEVIDEPMPRPETPGEHETAQAIADREERDKARRDKVTLENEERKERGTKVGHNVFYNKVQKRLNSRLFLALGTEGKKKFVQKKPHIEISKIEFREMVRLAKVSFEKTRNITYERYILFTRTQESGETLESFDAALTAQAATAELGGLEEELVRDLFISRMKNTVLQDTLTFETFTPDEVLKRAIKFEQSKQTTQAFQKSAAGSSIGTKLFEPQTKINRNQSWRLGTKIKTTNDQTEIKSERNGTIKKDRNRSEKNHALDAGEYLGTDT